MHPETDVPIGDPFICVSMLPSYVLKGVSIQTLVRLTISLCFFFSFVNQRYFKNKLQCQYILGCLLDMSKKIWISLLKFLWDDRNYEWKIRPFLLSEVVSESVLYMVINLWYNRSKRVGFLKVTMSWVVKKQFITFSTQQKYKQKCVTEMKVLQTFTLYSILDNRSNSFPNWINERS